MNETIEPSNDNIPLPIYITEKDGSLTTEIALLAISGGASYVNGMPEALTLRLREDGKEIIRTYVQEINNTTIIPIKTHCGLLITVNNKEYSCIRVKDHTDQQPPFVGDCHIVKERS